MKRYQVKRAISNEDGAYFETDRKGEKRWVGYIFMFNGRAFDPSGSLEGVTEEQANAHNAILSKGQIEGLDRCLCGQAGDFYYNEKARTITTCIGELVGDKLVIRGKSITFERKGRTFRGIMRRDVDMITIRRVG